MLNIFDYDDYRRFLKDSLRERSRVNPGFSMRSFARFTNISPSHLSRTLSYEKRLSVTSARQISSALDMSVHETDFFLGLVEVEAAPTSDRKATILRKISARGQKRHQVLPLDKFRIVADWHHFAILALANTRGFRKDPNWIARRLGIKVPETKDALERLISIGLLVPQGKTLKAVNDANITTSDDVRSAAIQENHNQHLRKSAEALRTISPELREFHNITLSANLSDVVRAKKLLREFIVRFNAEIESPQSEEVFQLNFQFYPLSKFSEKTI